MPHTCQHKHLFMGWRCLTTDKMWRCLSDGDVQSCFPCTLVHSRGTRTSTEQAHSVFFLSSWRLGSWVHKSALLFLLCGIFICAALVLRVPPPAGGLRYYTIYIHKQTAFLLIACSLVCIVECTSPLWSNLDSAKLHSVCRLNISTVPFYKDNHTYTQSNMQTAKLNTVWLG